MNESSIYNKIKSNLNENGKLPHEFSLEPKRSPNEISFMPGAMDGVGVFHMGKGDQKAAVVKISGLFRKYYKTGKTKYIDLIDKTLEKTRSLGIVDPLLESIRADHKGMNPNQVVKLTLELLKTSESTELVKLVIAFMGLFDLCGVPEATEILTTFGAYEDFTLFCVVAAGNWTDGNQIIFQLAKHVDGWGKIHAVGRLAPETDEIRDWILREGCSNAVMDAYLGLECAQKGDLISALRRDTLDGDTFESVSVIVDALLDEGPTAGISEYEYAEEALKLYLNHAIKHTNSVSQLCRVLNLRQWVENTDVSYKDEVITGCNKIINRPTWQEMILSVVRQRHDNHAFLCACNAANRLDIDIHTELLAAVKEQPLNYYSYMPQLIKDPDTAKELTALCKSVLPLSEMMNGMGDWLFPDKLQKEYQCLDFMLPALADYPLLGETLIKTGLNSKVTRNRNMACRALQGWEKKLGKPLHAISQELFDEVDRISKIEVNDQTRETMKKLLDSVITVENEG